ncbi:MAG: helix-turn-helix transcriptional regulator, partial [Clostridia bacterium]
GFPWYLVLHSCAAAHCTDPNLSVSMVAGMVGYNVEYLSRTFKRIMGTGLLSYIHSLQVEKAKALLEENPGISIRQVAGMVGFSGSESFIRTFKRHQGTTPGRYQEEHNAKNL